MRIGLTGFAALSWPGLLRLRAENAIKPPSERTAEAQLVGKAIRYSPPWDRPQGLSGETVRESVGQNSAPPASCLGKSSVQKGSGVPMHCAPWQFGK